jgi:hypothetical protein
MSIKLCEIIYIFLYLNILNFYDQPIKQSFKYQFNKIGQ